MSVSKAAVVSVSAVAVLAALYAAAGYIAVPSAVKWAVGKYLPGPLEGKNATVESVSFNPWTLALELNNLKVESAKHPGTNVLSLAYAKADASISSLFKMAPVLDALTVKSLIVDYDQTPAGAKPKKTVTESSLAQGAAGAAKVAKSESKSSSSFSLPAMSLSDVRLSDSSVRFRDSSQGIDMQATDINFELPLISTLSSATDLPEMTPKLSLKLDGNPITATGKTTKTGATITINVPELDAAKILKALPVKLPVSVRSLRLGANVTADYVMKGGNSVTLSGKVHAGSIDVAQGSSLTFAANALDVDLGKIDVFGQKAHVAAVTLVSPQAKGRLKRLMSLASADEGTKPQTRKTAGSLSPISPAYAAQSAGWDWSVGSVKVTSGNVSVTDDTLKSPATLTLSNINVSASNLTQAAGAKSPFSMSMGLAKGTVKVSGEAQLATLGAAARVAIDSVDLASLTPWIRHYAQTSVTSGLLSTNASVTAGMAGQTPAVKLSGSMGLTNLSASYLAIPTAIRLGSLGVNIKEIDTSKQTAAVSSVALQSPSVTIARSVLDKLSGGNGSSNSKSADKTQGNASAKSAASSQQKPSKSTAAKADWAWSVGSIDLKDGTATLRDDTLKPVAALAVSQINAKVQNLSSQKGSVSPYSMSATVAKGTFASEGKLSLDPMSITATNKMNGVQLPTFNPWLAASGASLTKGAASLNGNLTFKQAAKTAVSWKGSMQISDFNAKKGGATVLSWDKATASNINLQSIEPMNLSIELLEIDQPMQKMLKQEKRVGSLINLLTKGRHAAKIEQVETKLRKDVKLRNLVYKDGKFSAGRSDNSLSSVLLKGLNSVFGK